MSDETSDYTRELSSLLFQRIKPTCVELITVSLTEDTHQIVLLLKSLTIQLDQHKKEYEGRLYTISTKLADYIFFPLTNLLKKPKSIDSIVQYILHILSILIKYSWSSSPNIQLIDQLYPLILFISAGASLSQKESEIHNKTTDFKAAAVNCITNLIDILPSNYYDSLKRLSLLGDSITVLLDVVSLTSDNSQELIDLLNMAIVTTLNTTSKLDASKLANILPGLVSKLVAFVTSSKNLHFSIIVNVLKILRSITVRVFDDDELKVTMDTKVQDLSELSDLWNSDTVLPKISIQVPTTGKFRNKEWLQKTGEQLKTSYTVLFKCLLVSSNQNKLKVQTKPMLSLSILGFAMDILNKCSLSLFSEFIPLGIDILSLTISTMDQDDEAILREISQEFVLDSHPLPVYDMIKDKLIDLVDNKMAILTFSTDTEKLSSYLVAVKLSFSILFDLGVYSSEVLMRLKIKILNQLRKHFHEGFLYNNLQNTLEFSKENLLTILGGEKQVPRQLQNELDQAEPAFENKLDNIELPPSIDVRKIATFGKTTSQKVAHSSNLLILATQFNDPIIVASKLQQVSTGYLTTVYTLSMEQKIVSVISFLSSLTKQVELEVLEELLDTAIDGTQSSVLLNSSFALWMANNYLAQHKKDCSTSFEIDEFLQFDEEEGESVSIIEEASYLVFSKAQELLDVASEILAVSPPSNKQELQILEMTYSVSLDSIGALSRILSLDDFRTDILMNYLYPVLEALSLQGHPQVQEHAWIAVRAIIDNYYNGSLQKMILDNLDYLIDSLSLKLSVASNLTPSLSGILLIIIQVAGIKLLEMNQLVDILTEMFVIIDSYHGYSVIVEGFFIVFEELIKQVDTEYMSKVEIEIESENSSPYKPWGLNNIEQLLHLIKDSEKLIDPGEYDGTKEYFRKPNTPFGEQVEPDSDDEEEEEQPPQTEEKEVWPSPIPENIYFLVQRIFNYGFVLLTHDSVSLKRQILNTLLKTYPLLCTNYKLLLPIVNTNWPILMALIGGTESLSLSLDEILIEREVLIIPALDFVIEILHKDTERSLGRKFIESWEFLLLKIVTKETSKETRGKELVKTSTALLRQLNPLIHKLYSQYFMSGLRLYERSISDLVKYQILEVCNMLGVPSVELSRDVENILYVIRQAI